MASHRAAAAVTAEGAQPYRAVILRRARALAAHPLLHCALLAAALAVAAWMISARVTRYHHRVGTFPADTAFYRWLAIHMRSAYDNGGLIYALRSAYPTKDSLDLTLRLLVAPGSLVEPRGHLAVSLPAMGLWAFLLITYVFRRTGSRALGAAAASLIFVFPTIYDPFRGMVEYWKDNLATWILGSAVLAWLLADGFRRGGWSFLSGLLFGLLAWQRTVAALFAAIVFAPVMMVAAYRTARAEGPLEAARRIAAFAMAPLALGAGLVVSQYKSLYSYYAELGYNYGTPWAAARALGSQFSAEVGLAPAIVIGAGLGCALLGRRRGDWRDAIVPLWMAAALPVAVVGAGTMYVGAYQLWPPLLVIAAASCLPRPPRAPSAAAMAAGLFAVAIGGAALTYHGSQQRWREEARQKAPVRRLYQHLGAFLASQPAPRYNLLFDEVAIPFMAQVFFDQGAMPPMWSGVGMTIHDSYYRAQFGAIGAEQIAARHVEGLERVPDTIAVGYCDPEHDVRPHFIESISPVAADVAVRVNTHLSRSPHWRAVRRFEGAYRCLYVYVYSTRRLTDQEKWAEVEPVPATSRP